MTNIARSHNALFGPRSKETVKIDPGIFKGDVRDLNIYCPVFGLNYEEQDREITEYVYKNGNYSLYTLRSFKHDTEWEPIRSDPRWKALMKKMGLPE